MKLEELIKIADDAYPDGFVKQYYDDPQGNHGDSLARFIAFEIIETYDEDGTDENQLAQAIHTIANGRDELDRVLEALGAKARDL
jgi:hypothetical protein